MAPARRPSLVVVTDIVPDLEVLLARVVSAFSLARFAFVLLQPFRQRGVIQVHQTFLHQGQELLNGAVGLGQLRLEPA